MSYLNAYVALLSAYEQHAGNYQLLAEIAKQEYERLDLEGRKFLRAKLILDMGKAKSEDKKAFYANILADLAQAEEE